MNECMRGGRDSVGKRSLEVLPGMEFELGSAFITVGWVENAETRCSEAVPWKCRQKIQTKNLQIVAIFRKQSIEKREAKHLAQSIHFLCGPWQESRTRQRVIS